MKIITSVIVSLVITLAFAQAQSLNLLPGDAAIAPAAGDQTAPAIARGSNTLLAVWSDARANITGGYEGETSRDIYGVRLDANGDLLDAVPIAITAARSTQDNPKVVWNGSNWLVVFESYDLGGTGYYYQKSLAAVRVSPSGQVLDAKPIPLYGLEPSGGSYWAAASDGANWLVVNQSNSTGSDVVAVRISPEGVVLDPPTRVLVKATYYLRSNFKLAYAGGVFLLTFSDAYNNGVFDTKAVRFNSNLNLLDPAPLAFLGTSLADLAGNGSAFYIVWNRQNLDYSVNIAGSRVSTAGVRLDGNGVNLSGAAAPSGSANAVVWDGVNWRVTWGYTTTTTARVNASGQVLDLGGIALANLPPGPCSGNGAGGAQLVWTQFANNSYDVLSGNITANNTAGTSRAISLGAPRQLAADIAAGGNGYMVAYQSSISSEQRVMAQPLDAAGNPLTAGPIQLDAGNYSIGPGAPNVAWNGTYYLVAWGNGSGIVAQRLLPNGTKIDQVPFQVMTNAFGAADVATIGDIFLVTARRSAQQGQVIYAIGARVRGSDGTVLDASALVLGGSYVASSPAVTVLGGRFFVAYISNFTHDNSAAQTLGTFVPTTGPGVVGSGPYFSLSTGGGNAIFNVGLASNGTTALLVNPMEVTSGVENDLVARVIQADGTAGPVINLTPWSGNQYRPRVAWDGTNFIVTYQDQKNRLAEQSLEQLDARSDLFAMRVTAPGTIVDPQGFLFSALLTGESYPTVISLDGVTLLAGSIVLNDATFANYRIVYEQRDATLNKWPVAVATAVPTGGDVPLPVSFSSAGSGDLDGTIFGYFWDFGDGATSTAANPSHTYTLPGPFVATLTVTDNGGATTMQTVLVKAVAPNQLPVAVASAVPSSGPPPLNVIFYADGSYDPDGFLGNLQWTFSDGGNYYGSPAYHTFSSAGTYTATLTVYDSHGATGTTTITVYVGVNAPPQPTSVVSRKTHGTAGAFDINLPLAGNAGIECRSGGANGNHQVVFTFPTPVALSGATVTPQPGMSGNMAGPPVISTDGRTVTLNLTNVTNAQTLTLTLSGVNNGTSTGDVTVPMSLLLGDTNGNGVVNASDISQTKSQSGLPVTISNFRSDLSVNGTINASDVGLVKSRSGTAAPGAELRH